MTLNGPISLIILSVSVAAPVAATADTNPTGLETQSRLSPVVDVEIDPIAYALSGYSLHAGLTWDRFRLDLGAFALEVPKAFHGTDGLDVYGSGFGAKLDYHPFSSLPGLFVGAQLSRARETVTARATRESRTATHTTVGARLGYRVDIVEGFYVLPWIGVDVSLSDRTQTITGIDYEPGRAMFFPTIHIGKRF